jgi:hypothetical protein
MFSLVPLKKLACAFGLALLITGVVPVLADSPSQGTVSPPSFTHTATFQNRLAEAQQKFPDAVYLPSGLIDHPGRFLVQISPNDVALADFKVEGISSTVPQEHTATGLGAALIASADSGKYNPNVHCPGSSGTDVFNLVSDWQVGPLWSSHVGFTTSNTVHRCSYVTSTITRRVMDGLGLRTDRGFGIICQNCGQTNPWWNLDIYYNAPPPGVTTSYYVRHYINSDTSWSGWVNS